MDTNQILNLFVKHDILQFGEFTLASGDKSPFYLDLRYIPSIPQLFKSLTDQLYEMVKDLNFDLIIGIPQAGVPFATALAIKMDKPLQLIRKEAKKYGRNRQIEGPDVNGKTILLIDDLISSGFSKEFALEIIRKAGGIVNDLAILIDRSQNNTQNWAKQQHVQLLSLFALSAEAIMNRKNKI